MAMRCMSCGKGSMYGHNVSHAKNRTNRVFKPNLHNARVPMGTIMRKVKLCTKCLRSVKRSLIAPIATEVALQPETQQVAVV